MPGYDVHVVDDAASLRPAGTTGELALGFAAASPACQRSTARTTACARAISRSSPAIWETADAGLIDEDGYLTIPTEELDDIINVAGHRLSTGGIEEVGSLSAP